MRIFVKVLVLVLAVIAAFLANAYVQHFIRAEVFGNQFPRTYPDMFACALAGTIAASLLVSIPIAATYRGKAWLAAILISLPVIALRLNDFITYTGRLVSQVKTMAIVEIGSYLASLIGGSLLASLIWKRDGSHANPDHVES